jgi:thioredoxin 1
MATSLDLQVTDATFVAEVEQAAGLVVVDFWAEWCGPCRAVGPVIEKLAEDYRGRVKVLKLDTDANQATATRFNIRSIPSILFFKDGKPVDGVIGADPRLRSILDEKIGKHHAA